MLHLISCDFTLTQNGTETETLRSLRLLGVYLNGLDCPKLTAITQLNADKVAVQTEVVVCHGFRVYPHPCLPIELGKQFGGRKQTTALSTSLMFWVRQLRWLNNDMCGALPTALLLHQIKPVPHWFAFLLTIQMCCTAHRWTTSGIGPKSIWPAFWLLWCLGNHSQYLSNFSTPLQKSIICLRPNWLC